MNRGETILALDGDAVVGTITLRDTTETHGSPFCDQSDVAAFSQFAVRPSHQGCGIGSTLLNLVEMRAREKGGQCAWARYGRGGRSSDRVVSIEKGYEFVEYVQWPDVNYRSVILAKPLA